MLDTYEHEQRIDLDLLKLESLREWFLDLSRGGAGAASAHYSNGGGHALDFYNLGGTATTGADANAVKLLQALDPVMPAGASGTGQSGCRADRGSSLTLANMRQFPDGCTHVHVEVRPTSTDPLRVDG